MEALSNMKTNKKLHHISSAFNKYVSTETKLIMVFCSVMRKFCVIVKKECRTYITLIHE